MYCINFTAPVMRVCKAFKYGKWQKLVLCICLTLHQGASTRKTSVIVFGAPLARRRTAQEQQQYACSPDLDHCYMPYIPEKMTHPITYTKNPVKTNQNKRRWDGAGGQRSRPSGRKCGREADKGMSSRALLYVCFLISALIPRPLSWDVGARPRDGGGREGE